MVADDVIAVARKFLDVREADGPNRGMWVEFFQRFTNGQVGDSWCADFVSLVLDVVYWGRSPLPRTGSTITMLRVAQTKNMVVSIPALGDLFFLVNAFGTPHHVGIVTARAPLVGIAGNTSPDGTSSNGTGVFEHPMQDSDLTKYVFVRLPERSNA